jgi:electron transfer flavoprotein alpha subunit
MTFKRTVFTNKGFSQTAVTSEIAIISLSANAYGIHPNPVPCNTVETNRSEIKNQAKTTPGAVDKAQGKISIADAEIVVSAGRGLKGPENWGIVEELADVLHATTACSRPVSDADWRPHHEHVGQTGIAIRPNLYIAIGISGAIQHLAGVNNSKTIVVINKDPEAPFFKSANYGVVGDLFDIVPKLTAAIKNLNA